MTDGPLTEEHEALIRRAWNEPRSWPVPQLLAEIDRLRATPLPALDVPAEAIEWARELMRQGYRDQHVVTFSESGYGLEHPIRCRPNLIGCQLNEWLAWQPAPDREPGRYVMTWTDNGPEYARLAERAEP